jgi:hypothetical protein
MFMQWHYSVWEKENQPEITVGMSLSDVKLSFSKKTANHFHAVSKKDKLRCRQA